MQVKNVGLVFWFSVVLTACGADDPAREEFCAEMNELGFSSLVLPLELGHL